MNIRMFSLRSSSVNPAVVNSLFLTLKVFSLRSLFSVVKSHCVDFMMLPAARFVQLGGADDHHRVVIAGRLAIDQALGAAGRLAAHHADGVQLVHHLRLCHQHRHRPEGLAAEIGVQAGHDHAHPAVGQALRHVDHLAVEKLGFIDGHDGRFGVQLVRSPRRRG